MTRPEFDFLEDREPINPGTGITNGLAELLERMQEFRKRHHIGGHEAIENETVSIATAIALQNIRDEDDE